MVASLKIAVNSAAVSQVDEQAAIVSSPVDPWLGATRVAPAPADRDGDGARRSGVAPNCSSANLWRYRTALGSESEFRLLCLFAVETGFTNQTNSLAAATQVIEFALDSQLYREKA